jgi:osmotically-inducible protein OsmY
MPDHVSNLDDSATQAEIMAAISDALGGEAPAVGVSVVGGVALLSGEVPRAADRAAAVSAAQSVRGVSTVHDALIVHPHIAIPQLSEVDITRAVAAAISWAAEDPDSVRAELWRDSVILTGTVRWDFERQAVCRAVQLVKGIHRVDDRIRVTAA